MRMWTARAALVALAPIIASCSDTNAPKARHQLRAAGQQLDSSPWLIPVRISELHYDNPGTDVDEKIEISGPAGTSLDGWQLVLYNGNASSRAPYTTTSLSGLIPSTAGCGTRGVVVISYGTNGVQNGSSSASGIDPDGIALVDGGGNVVEFLSYEGSFVAASGPAAGLTSTDIGVRELGTAPEPSTPPVFSLQLDASGAWQPPAANTFGSCNDNGGTVVAGPIATIMVTPTSVTIAPNGTQQFVATAADASGNVVSDAAFTWTTDVSGVATVDDHGLATAHAEGDAKISASVNGVTGTALLHVKQPGPGLPDVRFSELHYDNAGTDAGEAIEIEAPAGASLDGYSVVLYDGTGGASYSTTSLTGVPVARCSAREVAVLNYPVNGIQNGSPDGMALVDAVGHVIEFLSYEGTFTALNGPAAGMLSTDIGAQESSAPIGQSLQRDSNNIWSLAANTFGACNATGGGSGNVITFSGRDPVSDPPLPIGFEDQLFATLHAGGTTITTTFTWTSDTPSIATIDANGVIHALAAGTAILRATAADGTTGTISLQTSDAVLGTTAQYGNNIEFGRPTDADPSDDIIIARPEYTISYSPTRNTPNWVSYDLDASHFGSNVDRCDCFTFDPDLPASFTHLTTADYTGAGAAAGYGIDRGHLVRSFDRTSGTLDNAVTYYLSNIVPQASDLNQGPWAAMENYLGDLARTSNKEVYIVAGVAGSKGTVKNEGKIVIPAATWKVAVIMDRDHGLADVHSIHDLEVVAAIMPNDPGVRNVDWHTYQTTVDAIEALTGYDLLDKLPDAIEIPVEANDHEPTARIVGATTGIEGTPLQLSGSSSSDPDAGDALTFSWDFGDGTTDVGSAPTHAYIDNGSYTVRLTVTDKYGLTSTTTSTVVVANAAPQAQLASSSGTLTATSGLPFGVTGTFSDLGANDAPWSYSLVWGDGNAPAGQTGDMHFALRATNIYRRAGTYSVSFAVTDKDGSTGTAALSLTVVRQQVAALALPGVINLNDKGQGGIDVALLSRPGFDPSQVNAASTTVGGVRADTHGNVPSLSAHYEDLNQDGVPDLVVRFARAALIDEGALTASSTELVLLADLRDGTQVEGHAPVQTHAIGKAN